MGTCVDGCAALRLMLTVLFAAYRPLKEKG